MGTEYVVFRDASLNTELTLGEHSNVFDLQASVLNHETGGALATINLRDDLTCDEVEAIALEMLKTTLYWRGNPEGAKEAIKKKLEAM